MVLRASPDLRQETSGESLVYAVSPGGHRQSYLDTLGRMFDLAPISGRMNTTLFRRLVRAERLLFATLDDDIASFSAIASTRSLLGRSTAALFLRAQKCFENDKWYYSTKRHLFGALRRLPRLTIATIMPFEAVPYYARVAHVGVCDPQYWDIPEDGRSPPATPLSQEVEARAAGRRILCALGSFAARKGLAFLTETLERCPHVGEHSFVVSAGRVPPDLVALSSRMAAAGALVVDRFITDAELESLYGVSDAIWSCYAPDYDQASGVFGRAVQFGVAPILRQGSVIGAFAAANKISHVAVPYGDYAALAKVLESPILPSSLAPSALQRDRSEMIGNWRQQFAQAVRRGLGDLERTA